MIMLMYVLCHINTGVILIVNNYKAESLLLYMTKKTLKYKLNKPVPIEHFINMLLK